MTRIFFTISILFFLFNGSSGYGQDSSSSRLILPDKPFTVSFIWKGDSIHNQWDPYAAMLIPVKIKNCPGQFYMQFDLGAPHSVFYKNKLLAIGRSFPSSIQIDDSATAVKYITFSAGKSGIHARNIQLFQTDEFTTDNIIGTLGMDFIGSQTVMIYYPNKTISINHVIPEKWKSGLTDFIYSSRGMLIPAMIRGKKTILFFDSGSSAFTLLTNKATAMELAQPGAERISYTVESWGRTMQANSYPSQDSIEIASVRLPLEKVTWIDGVSDEQIKRMQLMGIGGMTGNKLFLHSILILDIRNKRFGLVH